MNLISIKGRKSALPHKKNFAKKPEYDSNQPSCEFFSSSYNYIGEFFCSSGQLTLCDPLADQISFAALGITPPEDIPTQLQFPVVSGLYRSYYRLRDDEACGLLLIHENVLHPLQDGREDKADKKGGDFFVSSPIDATSMGILKTFFSRPPSCVYRLSVSIGRCLVAVDSRFAFEPLYSLYELEPEAFYDALRLHELLLAEVPYDPISLKRLDNYIKNCMETTGYAKGAELIRLTESIHCPWSGFRRVPSSHWGIDAISRAHREVTMIPGGIACDYENNTPLFLETYCINGRVSALYAGFYDAE